jgi:hypothetical protein
MGMKTDLLLILIFHSQRYLKYAKWL